MQSQRQPYSSMIMPGYMLQGSREIACVPLPYFLGLHDPQIYYCSNMYGTIWATTSTVEGYFKISKPTCNNCCQICHRTFYKISMPPWQGLSQFASLLEVVRLGISVCTILHITWLISNIFSAFVIIYGTWLFLDGRLYRPVRPVLRSHYFLMMFFAL